MALNGAANMISFEAGMMPNPRHISRSEELSCKPRPFKEPFMKQHPGLTILNEPLDMIHYFDDKNNIADSAMQ